MTPRLEEYEQEIVPPARAEMMVDGFWQPIEVQALVHTSRGSHYRVRLASGGQAEAPLGTLKFASSGSA